MKKLLPWWILSFQIISPFILVSHLPKPLLCFFSTGHQFVGMAALSPQTKSKWLEIPGGFGCISYWKSGHFSQLCYFIGRQKTEFAKYCCVNKNERRIATHSLEAYFNFNSSWWALGKRVGDTVVYATLQNILTKYSTFKFRSLKHLLEYHPAAIKATGTPKKLLLRFLCCSDVEPH